MVLKKGFKGDDVKGFDQGGSNLLPANKIDVEDDMVIKKGNKSMKD
jgi:hypothetical protein